MLELGVVHVGTLPWTLHAPEPVVVLEGGVLFLLDVGQHPTRLTTHGRGWGVRVLWQQLNRLRFDLGKRGLRHRL